LCQSTPHAENVPPVLRAAGGEARKFFRINSHPTRPNEPFATDVPAHVGRRGLPGGYSIAFLALCEPRQPRGVREVAWRCLPRTATELRRFRGGRLTREADRLGSIDIALVGIPSPAVFGKAAHQRVGVRNIRRHPTRWLVRWHQGARRAPFCRIDFNHQYRGSRPDPVQGNIVASSCDQTRKRWMAGTSGPGHDERQTISNGWKEPENAGCIPSQSRCKSGRELSRKTKTLTYSANQISWNCSMSQSSNLNLVCCCSSLQTPTSRAVR
jgi:hypothetical protein